MPDVGASLEPPPSATGSSWTPSSTSTWSSGSDSSWSSGGDSFSGGGDSGGGDSGGGDSSKHFPITQSRSSSAIMRVTLEGIFMRISGSTFIVTGARRQDDGSVSE